MIHISTPVRALNPRIHELVFKTDPLTKEEWDELEGYERMERDTALLLFADPGMNDEDIVRAAGGARG